MKKSIFVAVLGLAAGIASSFAQGTVVFTSYTANQSAGATTTIFGGSTLVGSSYHADLYYFLGTVSDPVNNSSIASIISAPTGFTALGQPQSYGGAAGLGYFLGSVVAIPGYTSGPITFQVVAYDGATWANSANRGRSGSFTMNSIPLAGNPAIALGDNGGAFPNFFVAPVPEPTTLALAGMGGLAALVAFRRKQA